jgi:hypothetical protein
VNHIKYYARLFGPDKEIVLEVLDSVAGTYRVIAERKLPKQVWPHVFVMVAREGQSYEAAQEYFAYPDWDLSYDIGDTAYMERAISAAINFAENQSIEFIEQGCIDEFIGTWNTAAA